MIDERQDFMGYEAKQFWCHHCQQQFTSHLRPGFDDVTCPRCSSDFCQIFTSQTKPNSFQPYQKPLKPKQRRFSRYTTHAVLLALQQYADDINAQKVREITEQDIKKLKIKVNKLADECLICKDQIAYGSEALKCPCEHIYHVECLSQWLTYKNSCPKCRNKILWYLEN